MTLEELEAVLKISDRHLTHTVTGWLCVKYLTIDPSGLMHPAIRVGTSVGDGLTTREKALVRLGEMLENGEVSL